jgi:hypothetical protein
MLQEEVLPRRRRRHPVPIRPTLVIGLGDFGREVGRQLAARLMLTEESLRGEGLVGPLLACKHDNGEEIPGFVRIMGIDWETWFGSNYDPDQLLSDITISDASLAEDGTPPRQREEERPEEDWIDARLALGHPHILEMLFDAASLTLRMHDTPMRVGSFDIQGRKQAFVMRVMIVCAAREAATTQLAPDIIRLLGKTYVTEAAITKGIQIFCYVGGTSRAEHLRALGTPEEYDALLETELLRILPLCRRPTVFTAPASQSIECLPDQLDLMWQHEQPQTIENCYLIDSQMANRVAVAQQRLDEPDETVVATALALNMMITSNADYTVRQSNLQRWDLAHPYGELGLFSTLGVAAYSLDHPKLRRLVYNFIVGKFLERVQPPFLGDNPQQRMRRGANEEYLVDEKLDEPIKQETKRHCDEYERRLEALRKSVPHPPQLKHTLNSPHDLKTTNARLQYRKAVRKLARLHSSDVATVSAVLGDILQQLDTDMEEGELAKILLERQRDYEERLEDTFRDLYDRLPEQIQAPLTRIYCFSKGSYAILHKLARNLDAPATNVDLQNERKKFAENQSDRCARKRSERAKAIRCEIDNRPRIVALMSRALLLAPLLVCAWNALAALFDKLFAPLVAFFGGLGITLPKLVTVPMLSFWMISAIVAGVTWGGLFVGYRQYYAYRLGKQLKKLVEWHRETIAKADDEAWRLAVAHQLEERERDQEILIPLCKPRGLVASLRDALLAEQFVAQDRILERIFFDVEVQADLRKISHRLASNDKLWERRVDLLTALLDRQWLDQQQLDIWLREKAGDVHKEDTPQIVDLVERYLKYQTAQRLQEIRHDLSNAAALFLRYSATVQDDPTMNIEMFGVNDQETSNELEESMDRSGVEILNSVDRLRWIFMHSQAGLHLQNVKFSVETQIP